MKTSVTADLKMKSFMSLFVQRDFCCILLKALCVYTYNIKTCTYCENVVLPNFDLMKFTDNFELTRRK